MSRGSMNPGFDQRIADWLEDDPDDAPDAVLTTVLAAFPSIPQRRAMGVPWRLRTMNRLALTGGAALAAVVIIGIAALVLARPPSDTAGGLSPSAIASPTATPSPTAAPPSQAPSPSVGPTQVVVDATGFAIPFQMTWDISVRPSIKADVVDIFAGNAGMNVFHVDRVGRDPCHTDDLLPAPLTTPSAFMAWLATIPQTVSGPATPITIGGVAGLQRVVTVGTLSGCFDSAELHSGIVSQYGKGGYYMSAGEVERWIALRVKGKLLAIAIWPRADDTLGGAAVRAVATLRFVP